MEHVFNVTSPMTVSEGSSNVSGGELKSFNLPASHVLKYITLTFYLNTFVFGLIGNGLVLYVIAYFSNVRRKSVANYYIWNLALADILFILTLPFFCYATFTNTWVFGGAVCKISYVMREVNKFASVFTLVALSVDRYLATYHTLSFLRSVKTGKLVCIAIWVMCSVIVVPYWLYADAVEKKLATGTRVSCRIAWPIRDNSMAPRTAWTYFQLTVGFLVPLAVIASSYILLMVRMATVMKCRNSDRIKKPNKKLTKTVLVVVVTFLVCQAPYHAVEIVSLKTTQMVFDAKRNGQVFKPTKTDMVVFMYLNFIASVLVFISSCCNPIIYGVLNENFRKLYQLVICRCRRIDKNGEPQSFADEAPYDPITVKVKFMFHPPCTRMNHRKRRRGHMTRGWRRRKASEMTMTTIT